MKIAFTSCMRFESFNEQPEWNDILDENPDYLFLLGDQIYMDWWPKLGEKHSLPLEDFKNEMKKKYSQQWSEKNFKKLIEKMKSKNGLFGIWDDHDFIWNNAKGAKLNSVDNKNKVDFSRKMFHEYFQNCSTNLDEIYYHIDTPFARVIFLDNRSYAQEDGKHNQILGETQFDFISEKLNHDLPYTIICGGLTLTEGGILGLGGENWKSYNDDLYKLSKMLSTKENVIFLAGDIHENKFIEPKRVKNNIKTPPQIISSGMEIKLFGERHNWAMLEFDKSGLEVKFYEKDSKNKGKTKIQTKLTKTCNEWLRNNLK